jgi:hypothetical protein
LVDEDDCPRADQTILTDEGLRALGMVAYWAALLEQALSEAVRACSAMTSQKTLVLVSGKTGGALLGTLRKLVVADSMVYDRTTWKHGPDPATSAITEERLRVLAVADSAIKARNKIVHSAMGGSLNDGHVVLYDRELVQRQVPESDIRAVADQLCKAFSLVLATDMRALQR